ncbi:hypothetical protein FJT64_017055 [Amphibalanus amphitrite]|uniref:Uncharacterized protein n=1 Tax=Amphibalanus amphitrite TaxID=1232801 RepID=A0A6A4X7M2_AMPAM|nr:hypothetical protein FJT64_017055 [Amphibalanus amphitrite]
MPPVNQPAPADQIRPTAAYQLPVMPPVNQPAPADQIRPSTTHQLPAMTPASQGVAGPAGLTAAAAAGPPQHGGAGAPVTHQSSHAAGATGSAVSTGHSAVPAPGQWASPTWPAPPWPTSAWLMPADQLAGGREPSAAALEAAARARGTDIDKFAEHAKAATSSMAKPPAPALRLAGVRSEAAQNLRMRTKFVAVEDSIGKTERAPATVAEYVARVSELLAHRIYHFPDIGLQLAMYMAWLLRRSIGRSLNEVRVADTKARELMATRPQELMTAVDFDHVAQLGSVTPQAAPTAGPRLWCRNFREGRCHSGPRCPSGRYHPTCAVCGSGAHHTDRHSVQPVPFDQPYPSARRPGTARGRGGRR